MPADSLSEALALMDARCVLARGIMAGGPWSLSLRAYGPLMLVAPARGEFWLSIPRIGRRVLLAEGDVAVVHGDVRQVMSSDPELEPVDGEELFAGQDQGTLLLGTAPEVALIGSHITVDRGGDSLLLAALDPVTHVRAHSGQAPVLRWLLDRLLAEMTGGQKGSEFAARQYSALLFVEVLRIYLAGDPAASAPGWLRLLATPALAPAVQAMQADPQRNWSLEDLARTVSMSRTTFAEKFREAAGVPPLTFLLQWRMRVAGRTLREEDVTISALSHSLGYSTESSFSHAFKRIHGVAPGRYRERHRTA